MKIPLWARVLESVEAGRCVNSLLCVIVSIGSRLLGKDFVRAFDQHFVEFFQQLEEVRCSDGGFLVGQAKRATAGFVYLPQRRI